MIAPLNDANGVLDLRSYRAFLEEKFKFSPAVGLDVDAGEVNPAVKPMTGEIARWMIRGGRRAFFGDFGLHKTCTQIEVHRLHGAHGCGLRLQVLPLDVRHEFFRDAAESLPRTFMTVAPASTHPDVWHDVVRMHTLNGAQTQRGRENHICPLQFDVVDRAIERWSNPGDEVSDPFGGLGTVPLRAVKLGRRGHAVELKPEYWQDGVPYLRAAEEANVTPSLFDLVDVEGAADLWRTASASCRPSAASK